MHTCMYIYISHHISYHIYHIYIYIYNITYILYIYITRNGCQFHTRCDDQDPLSGVPESAWPLLQRAEEVPTEGFSGRVINIFHSLFRG